MSTQSTGYSKTTLRKKLGIKDGKTITIINYPPQYLATIGVLPSENKPLKNKVDFIQVFFTDEATLIKSFSKYQKCLAKDGILWISWPKKTSKITSDLNGNIVREIGLSNGLVDVKIAAIDTTWSGYKFVYRLKDR